MGREWNEHPTENTASKSPHVQVSLSEGDRHVSKRKERGEVCDVFLGVKSREGALDGKRSVV